MKKKYRFGPVLIILGVFVLLTAALLGQNTWRLGERVERKVTLVDAQTLKSVQNQTNEDGGEKVAAEKGKECLYIWDSGDENSVLLHGQMPQILHDMKVSYTEADIDSESISGFEDYGFVVIGTSDYTEFGGEMEKLIDWTMDGGYLMIAQVPAVEPVASWVLQKAGAQSVGAKLYATPGIRVVSDAVLHGDRTDYPLEESFESSMSVSLDETCTVHLVSCDEMEIPLLWECPVGKGKIVTANLGIYDKAYRGIYSTAFSLLGETCAWPVINSATWYLDDFPSPVPSGVSTYIQRDYNMDIATFYTKVWWEDISSLAEQHGMRYTGMVIEEYSDQVEGPFASNSGTSRFQYFGNTLLQQGGEIGLHGYNHMPLVLDNFEYTEEYDSYKQWKSTDDMKAGLEELLSFCRSLYPKEQFQVYVPPSNILSEEGRRMLKSDFPDVKAIASVYLASGLGYAQEFEVAGDGMIETPRIISGYLMGDYENLAAMSELNFHYVSTHFQHPDDVMDVDRGAELGWEEMFRRLQDYTEWLYGTAPDIRSLTGSELAGAVQRFYHVDVERENTEEGLELKLDNFYDEAWLMVRFNEWEPDTTEGGELTKLSGNLYLLKATSAQVTIKKKVTE